MPIKQNWWKTGQPGPVVNSDSVTDFGGTTSASSLPNMRTSTNLRPGARQSMMGRVAPMMAPRATMPGQPGNALADLLRRRPRYF